MSVFKRKIKNTKTSPFYYFEFIFDGKRIQESTRTTSITVAREAERVRRRELEQARAGVPVESRRERIRTVADAVKGYLSTYALNHREKSTVFANGCLAHVESLLGSKLVSDLSEQCIRQYMKARDKEGASGRTINAELGELSRAIGKPWSILWPRVGKMEERKDVGRALSSEEESRLREALVRSESVVLKPFVFVALLTAMRSGEILNLTWDQIDLSRRIITVGRAKTSAGTGRQIPMNDELFSVLANHAEWFTAQFGEATPALFVFPYGNPPSDPSKPTTTIKTSWNTLRRNAEVKCRLHDLRHTAITKMAEAGVPETTLLAIAGHMSRAMIERYSHIRMNAKREAVRALSAPKTLTIDPELTPELPRALTIN